jgi:hypothetical protein
MDYVLFPTMSPLMGKALVENPGELLAALDQLSKKVDRGIVLAAARAAAVQITATNHKDLALLTIPWCIVTGEHPPVEPIIRSVHKGPSSLLGSLGVDLARPEHKHSVGPKFLIAFSGRHLAGGAAKVEALKRSLQCLTKTIVDSYYTVNSGNVYLVAECDDASRLYDAFSPLHEISPEEISIEPVLLWDEFVDTLRAIGKDPGAPEEAPEGCIESPTCCADLRPFTMPKGGRDRLKFTTWDTIEIPGVGEREIRLDGSYQIKRNHPSCANWVDAEIDITMEDMQVQGNDDLLGQVRAFLRSDSPAPSRGRVTRGTIQDNRSDGAKHCAMDANVAFHLDKLGVTVVAKEPIHLTHSITHIPPIGQGGGTGDVRIPLYNVNSLDGEPIAYLRRVKTHIGDFISPSHAPHHPPSHGPQNPPSPGPGHGCP